MSKLIFNNLLLQRYRLFIFPAILAFGIFASPLFAHQQPTTIVLLDIKPDKVAMELQIPLAELELAFGNDVAKNTETLPERLRPQLTDYLLSHIKPVSAGKSWTVEIINLKVEKAEQTQSGPYQEITAQLNLLPPVNVSTRKFTLNYDVILHQVVTHVAFVSVRNDWESGNIGEQPLGIGAIFVDTATTKIFPLEINVESGNAWNGFRNMWRLGMQHIREGTDHLLFLLVLLLPAPLLANGKNWGASGGTKHSIAGLLKIVTAFTVGHSLTLLIGALGLLNLPQKPVEVLIAFSILIAAIHAIRPIFAGREIFVAGGFGLIHGLAFAGVLTELNLGAGQLALSILGFNLGIELMQIFIVALVFPWFMLLSLTRFYNYVRIIGAISAIILAVFWLVERIFGAANPLGDLLETVSANAEFGILILAFITLSAFGFRHFGNKKRSVKTQG